MWSSGIYDYTVETHACDGENMAQGAHAECLQMYVLECVCVCGGAHAVFVPVALVLHKSVRMCVLAGVSGGEGEFLSHVPPCWLP